MTNWKIYKIKDREKWGSNPGGVEFKLDANVEFGRCERRNDRILFVNSYPCNDFKVGDYIEIDLDYTRTQASNQTLWSNNVTKKASSLLVIAKLESRINELESKISSLESSSSNQLVLKRQERDGLKEQLTTQNRVIKWGEEELGRKKTEIGQLKIERDDYQNKWVLSENEVRRITGLFNALQLENNRSKEKIKELKGELGQSRKDFLKQKISLKVGKLETFIQQLGVNRGKIMDNLLNAYKQLLRAEKNFNQNNIDEAENGINNIKQGLLTNGIIYRGISVDNTQKICSKCEKLAKLKLELNQIQQEQYQALQIQPSNN